MAIRRKKRTKQFTPQPAPVQTKKDTRKQHSFSPPSHDTPEQIFSNLPSRAIVDNVQRSTTASLPLQAKLTIGEPGDRYEREADTVAKNVVQQMHESAASPQNLPNGTVQRETTEDKDDLQMKPILQRETTEDKDDLQMKPILQRETTEDKDDLQMKPVLQRAVLTGGEASTELETSIDRARGKGQSLHPNLQMKMGEAMGADFSHVRVHTDSQSDRLNRSIQAKAFTTGQDVFFKQGEYNPGSKSGQELIAHELTHVVQQNSNTIQSKSIQTHSSCAVDSVSDVGAMPTVQASWINQKRDKQTRIQYRYWKDDKSDNMDLDEGWYKRTDNQGAWDENNIELETDVEVLKKLPNLLPEEISHTDKYQNFEVDEDQYRTDPFHSAFANDTMGKLSDGVANKVRKKLKKTWSAKKTYRWGEYEYEKRYVQNNSFTLGSVNYSATGGGLGLYVAKTPWSSASFANSTDGAIVQVTIPKGVSYLNLVDQDSDVQKELISDSKHSKVPQVLSDLTSKREWASIRDDNIPGLEIDFYQPSPKEFDKIAPHLRGVDSSTSRKGLKALHIIARQMGRPLNIPDEASVMSLYVNRPKKVAAKIGAYLDKISRFEFVPFLLSNDGLNFSDEVKEFFASFSHTKKAQNTVLTLQQNLLNWGNNPFSYSLNDFETNIKTPFTDQVEAYKERYGTQAKNLAKFVSFEERLEAFNKFLLELESEYNYITDDVERRGSWGG